MLLDIGLHIKFTKSQYCVSVPLDNPTDRGRILMNRGFWGHFQYHESKKYVFFRIDLKINFTGWKLTLILL